MRFTRRGTTTATYAAIVGDRWLWVALREPERVSLDGADVPVETDDSQPGHHGVRLDLAALPAGAGRHAVLVGRGRPLAGPAPRPPSAGASYVLEQEGSALHVVRRPPRVGATLRAARLRGESVEIDLDDTTGPTLVVGTTAVDLVDGTAVLTPATLAGATRGDLPVTHDGRPVLRRADDLADPGAGAVLPAVHPAGSPDALARVRWAVDGTLVVRVLR